MFQELESHLKHIPAEAIVAKDSESSLTYSDLIIKATRICNELGDERKLVILECNPSINWLVAYIGVLLGGHVPILLPSNQKKTTEFFIKKFQPNFIISTDNRIELAFLNNDKIELNNKLCLLLSTSGSTGSPKCVKLSHTNLNSNASSIADYLAITKNDLGTVNLPTNYSFGLSIVNSHLLRGASILFNQYSVVDDEFWALCKKESATSFAGVPHSYDLLSRIDFKNKIPKSIRYFTQAGGKLAEDKVKMFATFAASRDAKFFVMYGQTEASPRISYLPPELAVNYPTSIGVAVPGGNLFVVDENGNELDACIDGELVYEGPNVMMGYALEASDLILGDITDRLHTGDIAKRLDNGLFVITGRKSRFIKMYGNRISLDQVEVLLHGERFQAIATGVDDHLFILSIDLDSKQEIAEFLSQRLKLPRNSITVRFESEFPTLPTGKMDYSALTKQLNESLESDIHSGSVQDKYVAVFGAEAQDKTKSFLDLGGDSLTFVRISIELESVLSELPENWANLSIQELEQLSDVEVKNNKPTFNRLSNVDTLRAMVCFLVVAFHVFGNSAEFGLNFADDSPYRAIFEVIGLIRMPLFTALAGLLFVAMMPSSKDYPRIVKNKILTLVIPALLVSVIYFILRSAIGKGSGDLTSSLLYGYLHLWYLYALFIITLVIGLIHVYLKPNVAAYIGLSMLFYISSVYFDGTYLFHAEAALGLAPYFIIGILLYRYSNVLFSLPTINSAIAIILLGTVLKLLDFIGYINVPYWAQIIWLFASISFILILYRFIPKLKMIEWIGIYTYAIYLWHPLANAAVRTLLTKLGVDERLILFIAGLIFGILIPIVMYKAAQCLPRSIRKSLMGR